MTYQQACKKAASLSHLAEVDLEARRHFVGLWATDAHVLAGSDVPELYDIGETLGEDADHYVLTLDRLTLGVAKYASFGASFSLGRKDKAYVFATDDSWSYETCIEQARKTTVLFYSSNDQRGWLLDGAIALVHLARASLTLDWVGERHAEVLSKLQYIQGNEAARSAKIVLKANADIEIFCRSETRRETTMVFGASEESVARTEHKRIDVPWTYRDLVLKLWYKLERLQAEPQTSRSFHVNLRLPGLSLTGWETEHLISHNNRVAQRHITMRSESQRWVRYVKKLSPVTLLARDFGSLVSPSPDALVCDRMRQVPVNRSLLVAPMYVLLLSAKRWQGEKASLSAGCVQIHDSTFLYEYDPSAFDSQFSSETICAPISALQEKSSRRQLLPKDQTLNIFVRYPNGVVIFGTPDTHNHSNKNGKLPDISKNQMHAMDVGPSLEPSAY
jgi:hypothetical protein